MGVHPIYIIAVRLFPKGVLNRLYQYKMLCTIAVNNKYAFVLILFSRLLALARLLASSIVVAFISRCFVSFNISTISTMAHWGNPLRLLSAV